MVLTTYGLLQRDFKAGSEKVKRGLLAVPWRRVVLDEGHMIKNRNSQQVSREARGSERAADRGDLGLGMVCRMPRGGCESTLLDLDNTASPRSRLFYLLLLAPCLPPLAIGRVRPKPPSHSTPSDAGS